MLVKEGKFMNKKIVSLTIGLVLILISFQYWVTLTEQMSPPSPEWSRSIQTNGHLQHYSKIRSVPTDKGYAISLLNFKRMDLLHCSLDMDCKQMWSTEELDTRKTTWSDGNTTYFIQNDSLIRSTRSGDQSVISPFVDNFAKSNDTLVYWNTDHQLVVQQRNKPAIPYTTEHPVYSSIIVDEHVFIITRNVRDNRLIIYEASNELRELFQIPTNSSEIIMSLSIFSLAKDEFSILFETQYNSGGSQNKTIRTSTFNLSKPQPPSFNKLEFVDKENGFELSDIRYPSVFKGNGQTSITFSAVYYDLTGSKASGIFVGDYDDSTIKSTSITKNDDNFIRPVMLSEDTVAYFRTNGKKQEFMYSSSALEKRVQSAEGLKGDYENALYALITLSFKGLLLIFLSFTWIIPALGISFMSLALFRKWHIPKLYHMTLGLHVVSLMAFQLVLFLTVFTSERIVIKAPYLTELWHVPLIIVLAAIGCFLPILLSRTSIIEDNWNPMIVLTTSLNLFILFILLGPYFL